MGRPLGFAPEAALEDLGLPLWGPGVEVVQLLGLQGFWQHKVLKGLGGQGSRKYSALEGYGNQYWPICSSILAWRIPLPDKEAWQATVYSIVKSKTQLKWPCVHRCKTYFACGSSAPVRVECEGGTAAWLAGTLAVPSMPGHRLPPLQELCPIRVFFLATCSWRWPALASLSL